MLLSDVLVTLCAGKDHTDNFNSRTMSQSHVLCLS